jgi:hypothetical protein
MSCITHVNSKHMKHTSTIILLTFLLNFCWGQIYVRQKDESKDSLIAKTIGPSSLKIGKTYDLNDLTSNTVIYFEIKTKDTSKLIEKPGESEFEFLRSPYIVKPTITLFNVLYSLDNVHYKKYVVDTVDFNSGCCPCHLPDIVDSILFIDSSSRNELILLLTHPVEDECNSVTGYYALFYENFSKRIRAGIFSFKPFASYPRSYEQLDAESKKEMIRYFKEKKTK